jgi:hypothetical protein
MLDDHRGKAVAAIADFGHRASLPSASLPSYPVTLTKSAEHTFGSIKQWMNQGAFLMRGLEKVRGDFSLTALAYNLKRVLNIVELPKLIAALPA